MMGFGVIGVSIQQRVVEGNMEKMEVKSLGRRARTCQMKRIMVLMNVLTDIPSQNSFPILLKTSRTTLGIVR